MVIVLKETLTAADWGACRSLTARRDRAAVKKYRIAKKDRILTRLNSFLILVLGAVMLLAILTGGMSLWWFPAALLMLLAGGFTLFLKLPEIVPPQRPPVHDFPPENQPDTPARAAFFEDGCFVFWIASGRTRLPYQSISGVWEDRGRFYLYLRSAPPLILQKRAFTRWTPEDFRDFLTKAAGKPVTQTDEKTGEN